MKLMVKMIRVGEFLLRRTFFPFQRWRFDDIFFTRRLRGASYMKLHQDGEMVAEVVSNI